MKGTCLIAAWIVICWLFPISASAFEVGARGYYWFPDLDGTVKLDEAGIEGDKVDFEEDLGIDDDEFPGGEAFVGGGKHHATLAYTKVDYSGRKNLARSIVFNGQTYSANDDVTSTLEYDMIDLYYQYDFLDLENVLAGFTIGGVGQVKFLDGEVNLKTTTIDQTEDFAAPIPMAGASVKLGVWEDILEVRARGTAITYSGDTIYELLGEIILTPLPLVDVQGGYKIFAIDVDEDDVDFDYDMSGPFVGITVSF